MVFNISWLRGQDLNLQPSGYEPVATIRTRPPFHPCIRVRIQCGCQKSRRPSVRRRPRFPDCGRRRSETAYARWCGLTATRMEAFCSTACLANACRRPCRRGSCSSAVADVGRRGGREQSRRSARPPFHIPSPDTPVTHCHGEAAVAWRSGHYANQYSLPATARPHRQNPATRHPRA